MTRRVIAYLIIIIASVLLTGCGYTIEQQNKIDEYKKNGKEAAIKYISDKYNFIPSVISVNEKHINNRQIAVFSDPDGFVSVSMRHENRYFDTLVYVGDNEKYKEYAADNYEHKEIKSKILEELSSITNLKIKDIDVKYGDSISIKELGYNLVSKKLNENNVKDIINKGNNLKIIVYTIQNDISKLNSSDIADKIFNNRHNNEYIYFVNFKNIRDFNDYVQSFSDDTNFYKYSIFINDILKIDDESKYIKVDKIDCEFFTCVLEDGTFISKEETSFDNIDNFELSNRKLQSNILKIETDANKIHIFTPINQFSINGKDDDIKIGCEYIKDSEVTNYMVYNEHVGNYVYSYINSLSTFKIGAFTKE